MNSNFIQNNQSFSTIKKSDEFLKWYKQKKIKTKNTDLLKRMYSEFQYKEYLKLSPIKKYTDTQNKQLDFDLEITNADTNEGKYILIKIINLKIKIKFFFY